MCPILHALSSAATSHNAALTHGKAAAQADQAEALASPEVQNKRKQKRKRAQELQPEVTASAQQQADTPAGADANAPQAAANAVGPDTSTPAAPDEEKKQSRSARRKQLKRRFRRLGVAPPPQDPSSPIPPQPGPTPSVANPEAPAQPGTSVLGAAAASPPAKRHKNQHGHFKTHTASKGHMYFAESGGESDTAEDPQISAADHAGKPNVPAGEEHSPAKVVEVNVGKVRNTEAAAAPIANGRHAYARDEVSTTSVPDHC